MNCIIITGMHRSHTSLVSGFLKRCGLNFTDCLVEKNATNPDGFFEDIEILEIQKSILRCNKLKWYNAGNSDLKVKISDFTALSSIIQSKQDFFKDTWCFKTPQSTLFLDLLNIVANKPSFVFVYRDPISVISSLVSRTPLLHLILKPWVLLDYAKTYRDYNNRIIKFCTSSKHKFCFVHSNQFLVNPYTIIDDLRHIGIELNHAKISFASQIMRSKKTKTLKAAFIEKVSSKLSEIYDLQNVYDRLLKCHAMHSQVEVHNFQS